MKRFTNPTPLEIPRGRDFKLLDLSAFPIIEDFAVLPILGEISIWQIPLPHLVGAEFYSQEFGQLVACRWWEEIFYINRLERDFSAQDAPNGTIENPHYDSQPAWDIFIFEQEDYVYILQADGGQENIFSTWFRVSSQNYQTAWLKAIAEAGLSKT